MFTDFLVPKRNTSETRKPVFPQQESQKVQCFEIVLGKFLLWKKFSSQIYVSRAEISYESKGVPSTK